MRLKHLFISAGSLLIVGLFAMFIFSPFAAAADQVVLDWEQDADGAAIASGQVIDDEYHNTTGISVTVQANSATDIAAIFPSDSPPATDVDLGSPNETCDGGGPGIGAGGEVGEPGENCINHENVLILPTSGDGDDDGFIDDEPNDDANGGTITFLFSEAVAIDYIEILDQESQENVEINAYTNVDGTGLLVSENPAGFGDNSYEFISIGALGARRLDFEFNGSGAIASIAYTPPDPTAITLSGTDASGVVSVNPLFVAAFVALITVSILWIRRRSALA